MARGEDLHVSSADINNQHLHDRVSRLIHLTWGRFNMKIFRPFCAQGGFNLPRRRSRRREEAELDLLQKSASSRRRLRFGNPPCFAQEPTQSVFHPETTPLQAPPWAAKVGSCQMNLM